MNGDNDFKLRGVNLGGWLVLEKWMTPSLFKGTDAVDEFAFMHTPDVKGKIEHHRKTFITENDFKWIAQSGLNAVRIPVGYWLIDGDLPYLPGIEYLDWAVETAGKYNLRVLIDLHGAPRSQNGHDHSGRKGEVGWYKNSSHPEDAINILGRLAERYRDEPAFWGIELLNEPKINLVTFFQLRRFYKEAYRQMRRILRQGTISVYSDAFIPCLFSGLIREAPGYPVVMDVHWYQFGKTNLEKYFASLERKQRYINKLQKSQPIIVGEWSGMLSHETLAGKSSEEKAALQRRHIDLQLSAYSSAAGWFYWSYKTEGEGIWNYRWLVEEGRFPVI